MPSANNLTRFIVCLNAFILFAFLIYAIYAGDIDTSGPILFGSPWGQMTLIDLYSGFVLFALFIYSQEETFYRAAAWISALMLLGNLLACLYLFLWLNRKSTKDSIPDRLAAIKSDINIK